MAAFYAARNPNNPSGVELRFSNDVLSGVLHWIGLFGYALIVKPQGIILPCRRLALDIINFQHHSPTEEMVK